jgi:hypothetical protein
MQADGKPQTTSAESREGQNGPDGGECEEFGEEDTEITKAAEESHEHGEAAVPADVGIGELPVARWS